jgi:predicted nucleic acid-binding protein
MAEWPAQLPIVVPDTSVVIKWYRQGELLAPHALALRDAYLDGRVSLVVPSLLAYELSNVLRYKQDLSTQDVQEALSGLYRMRLEWAAPSSIVICRAIEIARAYETTVYDASFVALGESIGATFVTADVRLVQQLSDLSHVRSLADLPTPAS